MMIWFMHGDLSLWLAGFFIGVHVGKVLHKKGWIE